ncbi:MAG: zinc metallopeptidase [Clostridia bacterium]|nr:zinc metallopeptidase [Clostridia bacterium]MBR2952936.1 zinc metallopeptidase [Clostridia bacterium]
MNGYFSYYYMSNYYYIILVLPMIILSMIASARVNSSFKRYSKVMSSRRITGAQAAFEVLRYYGITNVQIERVSGNLTDHFDPRTNVIRLSDNVYNSTSVAAIGVACHEAGHAAQYAQSYVPIKLRNKVLPLANLGSKLGVPLAIIGYFLNFGPLAMAGVIFFSFAVIFQLITLPVEFNASKRALNVISDVDILSDEEKKGAKSVLSAAAMTYVASLAVSVASLLRLILTINRRRD